ncbi:MAG TPA: hypothetical protein VMX56_04395 [Anaerolineales bacterium]|nr:hypothetical protein [Anaerolineales bacterium]
MTDPHKERRSRWLNEAEVLKFNGETWIEESYVYALLDRELALERKRNAMRFCHHCKDEKPFRDRESNAFMHQIYTEDNPRQRSIATVPCYADLIWRNEDQ